MIYIDNMGVNRLHPDATTETVNARENDEILLLPQQLQDRLDAKGKILSHKCSNIQIFDSFQIEEIKLAFYILQCDPIFLSIVYGLDVGDCGVPFGNPSLVEMSASLEKAFATET